MHSLVYLTLLGVLAAAQGVSFYSVVFEEWEAFKVIIVN